MVLIKSRLRARPQPSCPPDASLKAVRLQGRFNKKCAAAAVQPFLPTLVLGTLAVSFSTAHAQAASQDEAATMPAVTVSASSADAAQDTVRMGALGAQPIRDTPFSITSVSEESIRDSDARFLIDALRDDPSVMTSSGGAASYSAIQQIQIRGLSLAYNNNYKRNGLSVIHFGETAMESTGRIDVLKGLSGFAYGFSGPGGVVNIVPKKPTEEPYRAVSVGYTSQSLLRAAVDLGGRFGANDQFGYRINAAKENGETPIDKVRMNRTLFSGYFDWRVTPDLTLGLDLEQQRINRTGQPFSYTLADGVPLPRPPKGSAFNGVDYAGYDSRETLVGLNADWRINSDWSFSAGFLKQSFWRDANWSFAKITNAQGDLSGYTERDALQDFPGRSAQASLNGRVRTGPLLHELTMGFDWRSNASRRGDYQISPTWASNLYQPVAAPPTDLYAGRDEYKNTYSRERGIYLTDTLHLNEYWRVIAGLRHSTAASGNLNPAGVASSQYEASVTTPMAAILFKPQETTTLYTSYAEGLEQGGIAPQGTGNAGTIFGPLKSRQVEVGVKWQPTDRWMLTAAAYRIDKGLGYTDTSTNRYVQSGSQLHRGLEFMVDGMLTRELRLNAGLSLIDASMERTGKATVDGRRPPNVPRQVFVAALDYESAFLHGLGVSARYRWTGNRAYDATNARTLPAYSLVDLGASYRTRIDNVSTVFRLHVDNLLNTRYWDAGLYPGLSRTVGLTMEMEL
ncbi:TonB-dependent receptor [Achromobacter aloeverae]